MSEIVLPQVSRRFASLLDREFCFWMSSPSVALLAALVSGKERPKRLLGLEGAPPFSSNIARVAGAAPLSVNPADIDDVLHGLLEVDGLSPQQVWGLAFHGEGRLSSTDWLARCAALKVATVELCSGSLPALAQWGPSPASFTIIDLDAEAAFAGVQLTALLTSDRALAARVQHLCLPRPEARDYIFDARPRGLAQDEPHLLSIVEEAAAFLASRPGAPLALSDRALSWWRRLKSAAGDANAPGWEASGTAPLPRWSARFAEVEARHAEVLRSATAFSDSLKSRLEQQTASASDWQRRALEAEKEAASRAETINLWEARFKEAETEAEKDAAILSRARDEAARQRVEFESALGSLKAERDVLEQKLARAEEERLVAARNASSSEMRLSIELRQRIKELENEGAAAAERESRLAREAEASRAGLQARVEELEAEARTSSAERASLLEAKTRAESSLGETRKELEASRAAAVERERARTEAAESTRAELRARVARLESEVQTLTRDRETLANEREALANERAALVEAKAEIERSLAQAREGVQSLAGAQDEKNALASKLADLDAELSEALADAARHSASQRNALEEQGRKASKLEGELATLAAREAAQARELEASKAALAAQNAKVEALLAELDQVREEERRRTRTLEAEATERERSWTASLEEQRGRVKALEAEALALKAEASALKEREAQKAAESAAAQSLLAGRIRRLEEDAALVQKSFGEFRDEKKALERARAKADSDLRAAMEQLDSLKAAHAEQLAAAETARDAALLDAERRGETLRAALEDHKQRLEKSEKDTAMLSVREARQAEASAREKTELSGRITRLEALLVEAQEGRTPLQSELDVLREKLLAAEAARDEALLDAQRRGETLRAALEEQAQALEQSRKDTAVLNVREARQAEAFSTERAELSERISRLEDMAREAREAQETALAQRAEAERALAALKAEKEEVVNKLAETEMARDLSLATAKRREESLKAALDEQRQRSERLENEAALERLGAASAGNAQADLEQDLKQARAALAEREAAHREKVEELELRAEKVRLEAEAAAEREKRQAEAREASRADLVVRIARLEAAEVASDRARAELLNRKRETDKALAAAEAEVANLTKKLAAFGVEPGKPQAGIAAPSAEKAAAPPPAAENPPSPGAPVNTGGLSALVNLWNTAVIGRPSRAKGSEGKPPVPQLNQPFEFEAIPDDEPAVLPPATPVAEEPQKPPDAGPVQNTGGLSALLARWTGGIKREVIRADTVDLGMALPPPAPKPKTPPSRPAQGGAPRPQPPRRPEPKPAPPPDEEEKLGGWLRGLADRIRKK